MAFDGFAYVYLIITAHEVYVVIGSVVCLHASEQLDHLSEFGLKSVGLWSA